MTNLIETIFPLILASLMVVGCGFSAELVSRSYKTLQSLSRDNTNVFPWLKDGWYIVRGLMNINLGSILFLVFTAFAAKVSDMLLTGSIWTEALISIWFVMVFASAFKISSQKRWKLF